MNTIEKYDYAVGVYLTDRRTATPSIATINKYTYVLGLFKGFLTATKYGSEELTEIPPLAVLEWRNSLKNEKTGELLKANTVKHFMTVLHSFFAWAVDHDIYEKTPVLKRDFPKGEKVTLTGLLTESEIKKIISGDLPPKMNRQTVWRTRAMIVLACESGLRSKELIGLKYDDIDFTHKTVRVRTEVAKGRKERIAPLPEQAERFIKDYLNHAENGNLIKSSVVPLFGVWDEISQTYLPIDRRNLLTNIKRYVYNLTGKANIGTHDLRHAFASWCLTKGVNMQNLQAVLGHSSITTTMRYAEQLQPKKVAQDLCELFAV